MKILFLNRVYPPADGATGELLADLAPELARNGWQVTIITSRATKMSLSSEIVNGVRVERVNSLPFTRASHWRRALSYLTVYPALLWRALRLPPADVVVTLTDPPLLLLLGPLLKWTKGSSLVHWAQDMYPEIAEEIGVLSKGGWFAGLCRRSSTWGLRQHDRVIVVGRCMKERFRQRGLSEGAIVVIPNWGQGAHRVPAAAGQISAMANPSDAGMAGAETAREKNPFRGEHKLEGRFVAMYSGNFGLAHDFQAMLEAAARLVSRRPEILFLFIGAGPRLAGLKEQVETLRLSNVHFLPAQPIARLAHALSGADLHLVSMLPNLPGLVVPSKVYGVLVAGRPCIFIGPKESEAARIIEQYRCGSVIDPYDGEALAQCLLEWASNPERLRTASQHAARAAELFTVSSAAEAFRDVLRGTRRSVSCTDGELVPQQIPNKTQT